MKIACERIPVHTVLRQRIASIQQKHSTQRALQSAHPKHGSPSLPSEHSFYAVNQLAGYVGQHVDHHPRTPDGLYTGGSTVS